MQITLAEERDGHSLPLQTFNGRVITVGRDSRKCQLAFRQEEWRMVSRVHAEFRWEDGRCLLVDKNSTFGTFLDDTAVKGPVVVRDGARVRFGVEGPVVVISSVSDSAASAARAVKDDGDAEDSGESRVRRKATVEPKVSDAPARPAVSRAPAARPAQEPALRLINDDSSAPPARFVLYKEVTRLGRDPQMDVALEASSSVSRHHVEIRKSDGQLVLVDMNSFNGTLLNGQRITQPSPLRDGDEIQLGLHGPILYLDSPAHPPREGVVREHERHKESLYGADQMAGMPGGVTPPGQSEHVPTMYLGHLSGRLKMQVPRCVEAGTRPILIRHFKPKAELLVGRGEEADICLAGLQISDRHALVARRHGKVFIEDVNSTNGVYVNGERVDNRQVEPDDVVQIGPFILQVDAEHGVLVFDTRAKTRVDVVDVSKSVADRSGKGTFKLLDGVRLSIEPNEFVGLLGPSGAGKSTLLGAMNGTWRATSGQVLINNLDLYRHLDSLKQSIGYVPQDDIAHRELTVYRTLYYVSQLRLSRDVSQKEIDSLVDDLLDVTELDEQRDVYIGQLSGGQRKRVSIAIELVTKPSVIFLDEPTAGLDPFNAGRIMKLFRHIAESGRTVILTTHLMDDVNLLDKVGVLMRGKLVFYGTPRAALAFFKVGSFKEIYDRLESPAAALPAGRDAGTKDSRRELTAEKVAAGLKARFEETKQYQDYLSRQTGDARTDDQRPLPSQLRPTLVDQFLQWSILARRYMELLNYDRSNLLILLGQAPVIGLLTVLAVKAQTARDFPYFVLALVAMWFGTSTAAREIVKERAVFTRERMVNIRLVPYVGSKLFVLMLVVGVQCVLLSWTLNLAHYLGWIKLPGHGTQLLVMILTGMIGVALGLFISAVVKTSEMATSLVPLVLIPQILFSGLMGVPTGAARVAGVVMPTTWSFDAIKRLSELPVLWGDEQGQGPNRGRGLYEQLRDENQESLRVLDDYQGEAERQLEEFEQAMGRYEADMVRYGGGEPIARPTPPTPPRFKSAPTARVKLPPEDLSGYVGYLHPWGSNWLDPLILLAMFLTLTGATLIVLKRQDIL